MKEKSKTNKNLSKKQKSAAMLIVGIILLLLSPIFYMIISYIFYINCPHTVSATICDFRHGYQGAVMSLIAAILWAIVAIGIIVYGIIQKSRSKR